MSAFDYLGAVAPYSQDPAQILRLDIRHSFLIAPHTEILRGARVLDLGAHDGRWSYALAEAGAAQVVGIEARAELVARFRLFAASPAKDRVELRQGDLHDALEDLYRAGEHFDVVALLGILYHVMDHFSILRNALRLGARMILVDGDFMVGNNPYIQLVREDPSKDLNAAPQVPGQMTAIKGIPSSSAMERMAEALGCDLVWLPWESLDPITRVTVGDYFTPTPQNTLRRSCVLRPKAA